MGRAIHVGMFPTSGDGLVSRVNTTLSEIAGFMFTHGEIFQSS
jgi:hypothetical protein